MKVPNAGSAEVRKRKITEYLLSPLHEEGRHKAAFFVQFGFRRAAWRELATALARHVTEHEVSKVEDSPYGKRYVVDGPMAAPDGRAPSIRTVWFTRRGAKTPRLVTAHPAKRRKK